MKDARPSSNKGSLHRLRALQNIVKAAKVDGLLLIGGIDGSFDKATAQVLSYLLGGKSGHELFETSMVQQVYEDVIFVVTSHSFRCYCQTKAHERIEDLLAGGLEECQIFKPNEDEESDSDVLEEYKVGSFVQMMKDLSVIGLPGKAPLDIESWPLVQSYGIEGIGRSGFFTMNFETRSLFEEIYKVYFHLDELSFKSLIEKSLPRFLRHYSEVSSLISRECVRDFASLTESDIIEPFNDYYSCRDIRKAETSSGAPLFRPRLLAGLHTKDFESSNHESLPLSQTDEEHPLLHFIIELADPKTPIACTRTYFLSSARLREGGLYPSDEDLYEEDNFQEIKNEWDPSDILYLYKSYICLIDAANSAMEFFSTNPNATLEDVEGAAKQSFSNSLAARGLGPLDLTMDLEELDLAGNAFPAKVGSSCLKRLKLHSPDLISQSQAESNEGKVLGSIAFGETFIESPSTRSFEILSSAVPLVQSWPIVKVENIIQRYMSKMLGKISDDSLISSDSSRNEITSTLGKLLIDGSEEVTLLVDNVYMSSIRGDLYVFSRGFVFYSPHVLPIVVDFEKDVKSFTRHVADPSNVMTAAVLLFELYDSSLAGFEGAPNEPGFVGMALNTLEPSACRYFNSRVWPLWMDLLSARGMKVSNESIFPEELWNLHAYASNLRSKRYPLTLSDECCEQVAQHFDRNLKGNSVSHITLKEENDSIPVVLVVGIPGAGHESLSALLMENEMCDWAVIKQRLSSLIDTRDDVLSKNISDAISKLNDFAGDTKKRKSGLLLPFLGFKGLPFYIDSILKTKYFKSGLCYVHGVIACVHTEKLVRDERSLYFKGIFEQLSEGYVDTVVLFGSEGCKPSLRKLLRNRLPNANLLQPQNIVSNDFLGQTSPNFSSLPRSANIGVLPDTGYEKVFVSSKCSILENEENLRSILQLEIDKSMIAMSSPPSLEDAKKSNPVLIWVKAVYNCSISSSQKELSVLGKQVKILKSASERICAGSQSHEVQWLFVGENLTEKYITNLIKRCVQSPQQPWKLRKPADLKATEKQTIQKEHILDPLPVGYRFTGSDYVDMEGNFSSYHPDFDLHAQRYLEEENKDIMRKNEAIQSYNADLIEFKVQEIIRTS